MPERRELKVASLSFNALVGGLGNTERERKGRGGNQYIVVFTCGVFSVCNQIHQRHQLESHHSARGSTWQIWQPLGHSGIL